MLTATGRHDAHTQQGFTLIELMIASTIALVALSSVLSIYTATAHHSKLQLQSAHLHQQMFGMLQLISRDLRRAGYWKFNPAQQAASDNPFQRAENRVRSGAYPDENPGSCILLAYDLNQDGRVGTGRCHKKSCSPITNTANVEQFGFRLHNGSVQSRYGGNTLACNTGYWQALNDPDIEIVHLGFDLHRHCLNLIDNSQPCTDAAPQLIQRVISIELDARLRGRPDTRLSLVRWVVVRNDRLLAGAP